MDERLDELGRPLFDSSAAERPWRLSQLIGGFERDERSVEGRWLDEVVRVRRGHPMLIAAADAEAGRRAGLDAGVFSTPTSWYTGIVSGGGLWLVDICPPEGDAPAPGTVRRHCGHELAFAALSGLAERFDGPGADAWRRRAARLRDRLALHPQRPVCPDLLAALWPRR